MKYLNLILLFLYFFCYLQAEEWKIGDLIINPDDTKGVVFWIHPDGSGGWMVALNDAGEDESFAWSPPDFDIPLLPHTGENSSPVIRSFDALLDTSGYTNTQAIYTALPSDTITYAAQAVNFNRGWYIPSVGQMRKLFSVLPLIAPIIKANGGQELYQNPDWYWTSTQFSANSAWLFYNQYGFSSPYRKKEKARVRAIRSFTNQSITYDTTLTYKWNTGDTLPFIHQIPSQTKEYTVSVTSAAGCSNRVKRTIFVADTDTVHLHETICQGKSYDQNSFHTAVAGIHFSSLSTDNGCKVPLKLHLNVADTFFYSLSDSICEGTPYTRHNFNLWNAGIYTQRWKTLQGCDSTIQLQLKTLPPDSLLIKASICEGNTYTDHHFVAAGTGIYEQYTANPKGCDSVIQLHLYVHPVYHLAIDAVIKTGETYNKQGFTASQPGFYTQLLKSTHQCDSVITLQLRLFHSDTTTIDTAICPGQTYNGNGFSVSSAGCYSNTFRNTEGFDSLVILNLKMNPSYFFESSSALCEGNSLNFHDTLLTETGTYTRQLTTRQGCDSIFNLHLTVNPVYHTYLNDIICEGGRYTENGFNHTKPGTYKRYTQSQCQCDSIITLNLTEEKLFDGHILSSVTDCSTHTYEFEAVSHHPASYSSCSYSWYFENQDSYTDERVIYRYANAGNYRIQLRTLTGGKCEKTLYYDLHVPFFTETLPIYSDQDAIGDRYSAVTLRTDSFPGMHYEWLFGDGDRATGPCVHHVYQPDHRPYYDIRLLATNAENCQAEAGLQLKVFKDAQPPNTFSPNGDGINDIFMPGFRIKIIDRNGLCLYNGTNGWDGTYKGNTVKDDTYFYELRYPSEIGEIRKTGYITVIK